jgi:hypothetical protein
MKKNIKQERKGARREFKAKRKKSKRRRLSLAKKKKMQKLKRISSLRGLRRTGSKTRWRC